MGMACIRGSLSAQQGTPILVCFVLFLGDALVWVAVKDTLPSSIIWRRIQKMDGKD